MSNPHRPESEFDYVVNQVDNTNAPNHILADEYYTTSASVATDSSLSGAFTTVTNIIDGTSPPCCDANDSPSSNQYQSPSKSVFQVVEVFDDPHSLVRTPSIPTSNDGTFESYYNMQRNGPFIPETLFMREDALSSSSGFGEGVEVENCIHPAAANGSPMSHHTKHIMGDECSNATNGDDMSSLTDGCFPSFDAEGNFFNYDKKNRQGQEHPLQGVQLDGVPNALLAQGRSRQADGARGKKRPWNIVRSALLPSSQRQHNQLTVSPNNQYLTPSPLQSSHSIPVLIMTSHRNLNETISLPSTPSQTPSMCSSNDFSELFNNELQERFADPVVRSYRRHYDNFVQRSSRAKKMTVGATLLLFLIGIILTTTIVVVKQGGDSEENTSSISSSYEMEMGKGDSLPSACCVAGYEGLDSMFDHDDAYLQHNASDENMKDVEKEPQDVSTTNNVVDGEASNIPSPSSAVLGIPQPPPTEYPVTAHHTIPADISFAKDQSQSGEYMDAITEAPTTQPSPSPFEWEISAFPSTLRSTPVPTPRPVIMIPLTTSKPSQRPSSRQTDTPSGVSMNGTFCLHMAVNIICYEHYLTTVVLLFN